MFSSVIRAERRVLNENACFLTQFEGNSRTKEQRLHFVRGWEKIQTLYCVQLCKQSNMKSFFMKTCNAWEGWRRERKDLIHIHENTAERKQFFEIEPRVIVTLAWIGNFYEFWWIATQPRRTFLNILLEFLLDIRRKQTFLVSFLLKSMQILLLSHVDTFFRLPEEFPFQ